jgi:hypothetical protein
MSTSICVEDFNGYSEPGHFPISYWADWDPDKQMLYFGGDWAHVLPMPSATLPTAEQAHEWAGLERQSGSYFSFPA